MRLPVTILASVFATSALLAADRASLAGAVFDSAGRPVEHATVLVYHAGVKHGFSTFCPSCYVDCGKRAITGPNGNFVIRNVDSELLFELLAVRDGFQPTSIKKVDPLSRSISTIVLRPRLDSDSPQKLVRGRVVDDHGLALRDAVIQPVGISSHEFPDGTPSKEEVSLYGTLDRVEPISISDEKGNFELASQRPASGMLVQVEARGFAPKFQALSAGFDRKTVIVSQGAVIRGRLVQRGIPIAGAEIGLIPYHRGGFGNHLAIVAGEPYGEIRVGTRADGSFVLPDVPPSVNWYVYAKMESVPKGMATTPVECATTRSGEVVSVGDLQLEPGHRLNGKVLLADGKSIPDGTRLIVSANRWWDSQAIVLHPDGHFECSGLPTGTYDVSPAVRGYRPAESILKMPIDHDIDDFTIVLEPAKH